MISFLFWNLYKRPLCERIVRLAFNHEVDVLMLAESVDDPDRILKALNKRGGPPYSLPWSAGQRLRIFTRLPQGSVIDQFNDHLGRLTIRTVKLRSTPDFLLAVVHYPSRVNWDRRNQDVHCSELARDIIRTEDELGHQRTILVGDFNMNPFDDGMVQTQGLHAVMTRAQARLAERVVAGRSYRYFYNPMWGHFGDRTAGPPGTYYFGGAIPVNWFWNIFDQVLLRPDLMDFLDDLQILDSDGERSLLTTGGRPQKSHGSDHLPLFFRLNL